MAKKMALTASQKKKLFAEPDGKIVWDPYMRNREADIAKIEAAKLPIFERIHETLSGLGIPYLVVGAMARDLIRLWRTKGGTIDVPFGPIQDERAKISWPPEGAVEMSVLGFREAFEHATHVTVRDDPRLDIPVATPIETSSHQQIPPFLQPLHSNNRSSVHRTA